MQKLKLKAGKIISLCMAAVMMFSTSVTAFAAELPEAGTYNVDADLSCYVSAMGGIEFGDGLVTGVQVEKEENGNMTMTVNFTKSEVTIYSIACYTFVDATNSQPAFYDSEGKLNKEDATYTLSSDTALNPSSQDVNYVDSLSFPISGLNETYTLYLYVNSQVMGVQFCNGNGTGSSNQPDVATPYAATLTVDWDTAELVDTPDETQNASSNVTYEVSAGYEVEIPAEITVDSATKTGKYTVQASNFIIDSEAYVTVVAEAGGTLSNGSDTVTFSNTLEEGRLTATGDSLAGEIKVTSDAASAGKYTGSTDFTINYFES